MTEPTTSDNNTSNNDDRDEIAQALSAMPRPVADPATREAHLAAALAEFDGIAAAASNGATAIPASTTLAPSNVISLASRRRTRMMALTAVAAAALFAVGLGVGRSSAPGNDGDPAVKNGALSTNQPTNGSAATTTATCADLGLAPDAVPIARFGIYAVHRMTLAGRATVVIVDTACNVVTQIDLGG